MKLTKEIVETTLDAYGEIRKRAGALGRAVYLADPDHREKMVYELAAVAVQDSKVYLTFLEEPDWAGGSSMRDETEVEFPLDMLLADDYEKTCEKLEIERARAIKAKKRAEEARQQAEVSKKEAAKIAREKAELERLKAKYEQS